MEKKIIELKKIEPTGVCLICTEAQATIDVKINRMLSYADDTVVSFHICDKCLVKMQRDIEICE